jgi:glycosyltransferase involved in cell wall biosynthesis
MQTAPMSGDGSSISPSHSIAFLQATIPDYRVPLVAALGDRLSGRLTVVCGDEDFSENVTRGRALVDFVPVANVFLLGRRLLWQRRTVRLLTKPSTAMLELNPRILNTWLILAGRRLRGRRTVLFGHAWPRRGPDARSDSVRHLMRRLSDAIIVYTDTQAAELERRMPGHSVRAAPNALYPRALAVTNPERRLGRDVIVVGRLVDRKKPLLLVDAFADSASSLPKDTRLVFVGDGPLRKAILQHAHATGLDDRVDLTGHVTDFEQLRELYARALVSVAPGEVGLSLTQSLWFGVPVLVARDEMHGPEIEAAIAGTNAEFFASDSPEALSAALVDAFSRRDELLARAPAIAAACVERYSLEAMVDAIVDVVEAR